MRKFKKGDLVFHACHGAGTVITTQRLDIGGVEGIYYVVELATGSKLMIPVKEAEDLRLRPLITLETIREVLSAIPEELAADFRQRRGDIEEKVNSGDQMQTTEVLRDLAWRERTASLSGGDRELMSSVKKRLVQILAMRPGVDVQEASQLLETLLGETLWYGEYLDGDQPPAIP